MQQAFLPIRRGPGFGPPLAFLPLLSYTAPCKHSLIFCPRYTVTLLHIHKPTMARRRASTADQNEGPTSTTDNPSSLLWAHQLKRENGYLLGRMSKVESEHNGFDVRIGAVEALTESLRTAVEDLARNDDAADNARQAWITAAEDRIKTSEKQIDILRTSQPRAAELGAKVDGLQGQLQQALSDHHSILQKLRAVEAEMQTRRDEVERIAQRNSLGDSRILMLRLDALELNRKENERRAEVMQMKISSLEKQYQATSSRNSELQSRLDELSLGKENVRPTTETPTQVLQESQSISTQCLPESQAVVPTQIVESSSNPAFILVPESEVPTQVLHASPPSYEDISTSPFANFNRE